MELPILPTVCILATELPTLPIQCELFVSCPFCLLHVHWPASNLVPLAKEASALTTELITLYMGCTFKEKNLFMEGAKSFLAELLLFGKGLKTRKAKSCFQQNALDQNKLIQLCSTEQPMRVLYLYDTL